MFPRRRGEEGHASRGGMTGLCARPVGSNPPLWSGEAISGPGRKRGTREGEQNAAGRKREKGEGGGCGARGMERDGKSWSGSRMRSECQLEGRLLSGPVYGKRRRKRRRRKVERSKARRNTPLSFFASRRRRRLRRRSRWQPPRSIYTWRALAGSGHDR